MERGVPVVETTDDDTPIADAGSIAAVDREDEGITVGSISIPPVIFPRPEDRDRVEREFLESRQEGLPSRYELTVA